MSENTNERDALIAIINKEFEDYALPDKTYEHILNVMKAAIAHQNPINDSQTQHWELDKNNLCFKGSVVDTEAKQSQEVKDALKEAAKIVDARADNWDLFNKNTVLAVELRIASKGIRALIK